ncbi:DegV family protein [Sedimentibacter hydroxybenzoicus DSM 7310]|uniref:DegV family protein n=1 Tax=Sedimentibacter hydroxybenzoicus DSM 7310 TaxID=1123245 RepID=A0A974BI28_SEDHY|nr:DegV family protein [Sedimentibacter hydroxybenzoicus]NYB73306.1 DegV family protein [Sedimentibacter hydroxybenzoicus DSM 7310]
MKDNLIVDSCVDFNEDTQDIGRVPFRILIDEEEIIDENLNIHNLIAKMKNTKNQIKTACAPPEDFINKWKEHKNNFVVTISSQLSGSYNSAMVAVESFKEKFPNSFVHIFDSKTAATGETLIAMKVKQLIEENFNAAEIIEQTNKYISKVRTIFILESLDNLAKNGRISNLKAILGSMLHIVPIMGEDGEGRIELKESVRGKKRAFARLVDMIAEYNVDFENTVLGITHVNCLEKAEKLRDDIKAKYPFKDIKIFNSSGLSTVYADDGGIVIAF